MMGDKIRGEKETGLSDGKTDKPIASREYRGNVVGALFLVAVGLVLLANNFGYLPWDVWGQLWRYWPVFLILIGVQLVLGRSIIARVLVILFGFGIIIWILLFTWARISSDRVSFFEPWHYISDKAGKHVFRKEEVSIGENDLKGAEVKLRSILVLIKSGQLFFGDEVSSDLFRLNASYYGGEAAPVVEKKVEGDKLEIVVTAGSDYSWMLQGAKPQIYNMSLGRQDLLTNLEMIIDAGEVNIDCGKVLLDEISLEVGAGSATLNLGERSIPHAGIKITVGAGTVKLIVPKNVGLTVKHRVALGNLKVEGVRIKEDGEYRSTDLGTVKGNLSLEVNIGAGSVDIERVEEI